MALKVELKPGEKLLVGNCIITNSDQRTRLFIEGKAPVLREKDILTAETADTPARRIYLAVQLMYISDDVASVQENYLSFIRDIVTAAPSTATLVNEINNEILTGSLYKALRAAKRLIQYEEGLLSNAAPRGARLSTDDEDG